MRVTRHGLAGGLCVLALLVCTGGATARHAGSLGLAAPAHTQQADGIGIDPNGGHEAGRSVIDPLGDDEASTGGDAGSFIDPLGG